MPDDLTYDPARPLYREQGKRYKIGDCALALADAYAAGKPVLIYIHGRANNVGEPKKSVNKNIYTALDSYGVSTVGFTWDADFGNFDERKPLKSVGAFVQFNDELKKYLATTGTGKSPPTLLAHSMGCVVVSGAAQQGQLGSGSKGLYRNVVLSAAAVESKGHAGWLGQIGSSACTYVLVNSHDPMLTLASLGLPLKDMLGKKLKAPGVDNDRVVYVDASDLGVKHPYYLPKQQNNQASLKSFYDQAITGIKVNFDAIAKKATIDGVNVMRLNDGSGANGKHPDPGPAGPDDE